MNARTIALSAATAVLAGCAAHGSGATNLLRKAPHAKHQLQSRRAAGSSR